MKKAKLTFEGKAIELDVIVGSENEIGIDISRLKTESGFITLDPGFKNTGSCESKVTFLDGDNGILRYRGYSIEDLSLIHIRRCRRRLRCRSRWSPYH